MDNWIKKLYVDGVEAMRAKFFWDADIDVNLTLEELIHSSNKSHCFMHDIEFDDLIKKACRRLI